MSDNGSSRYALLDGEGVTLAYGRLESPTDAAELWLRVSEEQIPAVLKNEYVRLVQESGDAPDLFGRVMGRRDDVVRLERQASGKIMRRNLRIPVCFDTFLYPVDGSRKGRCQVISYDLSSGGIAFFCDRVLALGERLEIVIPVTFKPLLLQGEILRQEPADQGRTLYAMKFVDLCEGQEALVREAVFSIQLSQRNS